MGSGLASLSYVLFSGAVGLAMYAEVDAATEHVNWSQGATNLVIEPGLMPMASSVYVMKASEEESFFKALRRSRNVVHRGTLR
jgi:hypothetical protein